MTHFVYVHNGMMYASNKRSGIPGFESVYYTGSVDVTVGAGECVHYFVKRENGYAMITKYNPTNSQMSFTFSSAGWYAYALDPSVSDFLTFFTDRGLFNISATRMFEVYKRSDSFQGLIDKYEDMLIALSVCWSPGLFQGLQFSSEFNIELYDNAFNFNFLS